MGSHKMIGLIPLLGWKNILGEKSIYPPFSRAKNGSQGALEKRKNKVVRQINKLDMDGEEPKSRHNTGDRGSVNGTNGFNRRIFLSGWD